MRPLEKPMATVRAIRRAEQAEVIRRAKAREELLKKQAELRRAE